MLEAFSKIATEWFRPIRFFGAVVITALLLVALRFVPPISDLLKDSVWRWGVLAFVFAAACLLTYPAERRWKRHSLIARLSRLTPHEQKVLGRYLQEDSRAIEWPRFGGTVDVLAKDGLLTLLASDASERNLCPDVYQMNETVWVYLRAHPELVDLERSADAGN